MESKIAKWKKMAESGKSFAEAKAAAQYRWDAIAKPLDGLGLLEKQIVRIAGLQGDPGVRLAPARLLVFCADNGIVDAAVSQSGREVTTAAARSMCRGEASVSRMAAALGVEVQIVDMGMETPVEEEGICDCSLRRGSRNFLKECAMTQQETSEAIDRGIALAKQAKEEGIALLAVGELGIGNTTTSAALAAGLLGLPAEAVCGRGAGLDDAGLQRKTGVVRMGLKLHGFDGAARTAEEAFYLLRSLGGYDIAGICGLCIGAAAFGLPLILDGVITVAAALCAARLAPCCEKALLASHCGKEQAMVPMLKALELEAPITAQLALGEGTGAMLELSLLHTALAVYEEAAGFPALSMEAYRRAEKC